MLKVSDVRQHFITKLSEQDFTTDRTGSKTIEMIGASFLADEPAIFGTVNEQYVADEIAWYESMSTNVNDIGEKVPAAWKATANKHGEINSNYGHLIYSKKYFSQFQRVVDELLKNPDSRRAVMIYTRPSIWVEYNENGKNDFICTNAVAYYIRGGKVHTVVQMRSNDIWAGYRNDFAWAKHVRDEIIGVLRVHSGSDKDRPVYEAGDIHWQVQNLHCYERNFWMIDSYAKYGKVLPKEEYDSLMT